MYGVLDDHRAVASTLESGEFFSLSRGSVV